MSTEPLCLDCDQREADHVEGSCPRYRTFDPDDDPWDGWGWLEGDDE
ncbi:hypothetical protein OHA01_26280 [Micromonospora zamorensis]|nr:hypothetical protein OHA01_26280 [Micromonospora zamorensis]